MTRGSKWPRKPSRQRSKVTSKELAEMGFCEKRVLLAHVHGEHRTPLDQQDIKRGLRIHDRYFREGLAARDAQQSDRRCFVATSLFGESASETVVLRQYRDTVLQRSRCGRGVVRTYYAVAPWVCTLLRCCPWLQMPMRTVIEVVIRRCRRTMDGQGRFDERA